MILSALCTAAVWGFLTASACAASFASNKTVQNISNTVPDEEGSRYTFVHQGFYSDGYIIEMGWNLDEAMRKNYPDSREITLADHSTITVYFGKLSFGDQYGNAAAYLDDSGALAAIGSLMDSLKNENIPKFPALETPLVTNITAVGEKDLHTLAREYLESGDTIKFMAAFMVLDIKSQEEYCQTIYDRDKVSFFAAVIPCMDEDFLVRYADQAERDGKTNFFAVMLPHMTPEIRDQYAQKYYAADNVSRFCAIAFFMTEDEKQEWLVRAKTDQKNAIAAFLSA